CRVAGTGCGAGADGARSGCWTPTSRATPRRSASSRCEAELGVGDGEVDGVLRRRRDPVEALAAVARQGDDVAAIGRGDHADAVVDERAGPRGAGGRPGLLQAL